MTLTFREILEDDLISANNHINGSLSLKNKNFKIKYLDPNQLLDQLGINTPDRKPNNNKKDFLSLLDNGDGYNWNYLISHEVPPVVVVNNSLADGIHRCLVASLLNVEIKAICFTD